jgi:hypothetical protein
MRPIRNYFQPNNYITHLAVQDGTLGNSNIQVLSNMKTTFLSSESRFIGPPKTENYTLKWSHHKVMKTIISNLQINTFLTLT